MYKLNVDNRILNNLKQQLNEMIDDERSLISVPEFKQIFYMYFKGEAKASLIYDKLLPQIQCYLVNEEVHEKEPKDANYETMISI
jgi:hypothetical protein